MFQNRLFKHNWASTRRWAAPVLLGAIIAGYAWIAVRGPQGIQALIEKHREIRDLEVRNAADARENQRLRERIERLGNSKSEQEMEIRKQLKLLRPGETTFILPESESEQDQPSKPGPAPETK